MIEILAAAAARRIKQTVPEHPASLAVLTFSMTVVLNVVFIVALSLSISMFTGNLREVAVILVSFAVLRQLTGGVHLKSGTACVVVTTLAFTVMSYIRPGEAAMYGMNAVSFLLILLLAPVGVEKQTRIPKRHYPKLKVIGAVLVLAAFFIQSPALTVSFFVQSLTLLSGIRTKRG